MVNTTSRAKRLIFSQVGDLEVGKISTGVFDEIPEYTLIVVADEYDLLKGTSELSKGTQIVPDNRMAGDLEKRLLSNEHNLAKNIEDPTFGTSRLKGLNL